MAESMDCFKSLGVLVALIPSRGWFAIEHPDGQSGRIAAEHVTAAISAIKNGDGDAAVRAFLYDNTVF